MAHTMHLEGGSEVLEEYIQNTCGNSMGNGVLGPMYSVVVCGVKDQGGKGHCEMEDMG